jgi:hypothetical protein
MDEVHFQQHGSRCRLWVAPEITDPVCYHAPTRKSISYFGAVRLRDGKLVMSRPKGMFDARTCWDFLRKLEHISRQADRQVIVISDNARYHHANLHAAWRQSVADHFRLHFLPPYSPQLNPIERVWKLLRRPEPLVKRECIGMGISAARRRQHHGTARHQARRVSCEHRISRDDRSSIARLCS